MKNEMVDYFFFVDDKMDDYCEGKNVGQTGEEVGFRGCGACLASNPPLNMIRLR